MFDRHNAIFRFRLVLTAILMSAVAGAAVAQGGDPWLEQAKLIAADGAAGDNFGFSVALDGDTAVVGAPFADVDGNSDQGAAYILVRDGKEWTEAAKLTASDGAAGDGFGHSIVISGDTVVIGAVQAFSNSPGAAYVFTHDGSVWTQQAKLTASDGANGDEFGFSVALFGDTVLVGAERAEIDGHDNGAAYVFTRDGGGTWAQQAKLVPDDWPFGTCASATCPRFGHSVAFWEGTAIVGTPNLTVDGVSRAGAAYVFVLAEGEWTQQARLTWPGPAAFEFFGSSVALRSDTALVGVPGVVIDGDSNRGAAHVFARNEGIWTEQQQLTASDGTGGSQFGQSVALLDNSAVVGAQEDHVFSPSRPGSAYIYVRDGATWNEQQRLTAADGLDGDRFGVSVAYADGTVLVGANRAAINGNSNQGAAYVFAAEPAGDPALGFDPAALNFGQVEVGATSAPQTATLTNSGGSDATGLIFNPPGSGFDVDTADCGDTLAAGTGCEVSVTFTPPATGAAAATLTVDSDQAVSADLTLSGEGIEPAQLSFSPATLDFGNVDVGTTSDPLDATLSNTGDSDATGLSFSTPGSGFSVVGNTCGAVLAVGGNCLLSLTFTPQAAGPASDTLTVDGDNEVTASLNLSGNGDEPPQPGVLSVTPATLDFGDVVIGTSDTRTLTVSNAAEAGAEDIELGSLEVTAGAPEFGIAGGTCQVGTILSPGEDCTVDVSFQPDSVAGFSGEFTVATTDGQKVSVGRSIQ